MPAPLALSEFFDLLPVSAIQMDLERNDELSGLGSGDLVAGQLADPFWYAQVSIDKDEHEIILDIEAVIRSFDGPFQPFLFADPRRLHPKGDPTGAIIGNNNLSVRAINADRRILMLQGFPLGGYTLWRGDRIQLTQGTMRRYFEVSVSAPASTSTGYMEVRVTPWLPATLAVGASISVKRAAVPMIIEPGSLKTSTGRQTLSEGLSFKAVQKLVTG